MRTPKLIHTSDLLRLFNIATPLLIHHKSRHHEVGLSKIANSKVARGPIKSEIKNQFKPLLFLHWAIFAFISINVPHPITYPCEDGVIIIENPPFILQWSIFLLPVQFYLRL